MRKSIRLLRLRNRGFYCFQNSVFFTFLRPGESFKRSSVSRNGCHCRSGTRKEGYGKSFYWDCWRVILSRFMSHTSDTGSLRPWRERGPESFRSVCYFGYRNSGSYSSYVFLPRSRSCTVNGFGFFPFHLFIGV